MKIKVEKSIFLEIPDIFISRIDCTPENIVKLLDTLEFKNNIEVIADMGFENEKNFPIEKIEKFKIKHNSSFEKSKYSNGWFRLIASPKECINFLNDIFEFDIEAIFILDLRDEGIWKQSPHYTNMELSKELIKQNVMNSYLTAFIDEYEIVITFNKDTYDAKKLVAKIKALFLRRNKLRS